MIPVPDPAASDVHLRPMTGEDVESVAWIEAESFSEPWSATTFARLVHRANARCLVATAEGRIVGYAILWCAADEGEVANVAVLPEWRGKGIGGRLLGRLLDEAGSWGLQRVYLEVRPSNLTARRMYEARGFRALGRRPGYYKNPEEDALVLGLDLTED